MDWLEKKWITLRELRQKDQRKSNETGREYGRRHELNRTRGQPGQRGKAELPEIWDSSGGEARGNHYERDCIRGREH